MCIRILCIAILNQSRGISFLYINNDKKIKFNNLNDLVIKFIPARKLYRKTV